MTDPVERERRKHRRQEMERQWTTAKIGMWLEVGGYVALFALFVAGVFFGR
jgi:hypothetical protein